VFLYHVKTTWPFSSRCFHRRNCFLGHPKSLVIVVESCYPNSKDPIPYLFCGQVNGADRQVTGILFYQQAHRSLPYASPTGTFRLLLSPSCGHSGAQQVLVIELSPAVNFDCEPCSISTMQLFLPRPKVTLSFELTSSVSLA